MSAPCEDLTTAPAQCQARYTYMCAYVVVWRRRHFLIMCATLCGSGTGAKEGYLSPLRFMSNAFVKYAKPTSGKTDFCAI